MSAPASHEHGPEPVRGLPAPLPAGEHILWQGAPDWRVLARTALHLRWVVGWFALIALWRVGSGLVEGRGAMIMVGDVVVTAGIGAIAVGLLAGYAWVAARSTVYTVTNRRFVLRHGAALSKCFNLPFSRIESAGLKLDAAGAGDIPLRLTPESKVAWPHLWPHVRPWRILHPEPMLRAVPDARAVAEVLTQAWRAEIGEAAQVATLDVAAAPRPPRVPRGLRPSDQPAAA